MTRRAIHWLVLALLLSATRASIAQPTFLGFDRNDYPGDAALPALRKSFLYTSYWLNNPPGESANSWMGKRALLKRYGFGFLVLFNGRMDAELQGKDAAKVGAADGQTAVVVAVREGFARNVRIFLDQEEGGRLLPEQAAYIFAWIDAVRAAGARAGVYCSGIQVRDESGLISTAADIAQRERSRERQSAQRDHARLTLWIANDACPPAPGCTLQTPAMTDAFPEDVRRYATVWQYAQSPRRMEFSAGCPKNAASDGNCYPPGLPRGANSFVDLDAASLADPSEAP